MGKPAAHQNATPNRHSSEGLTMNNLQVFATRLGPTPRSLGVIHRLRLRPLRHDRLEDEVALFI